MVGALFFFEPISRQRPIEDFIGTLESKARAKCYAYLGLLEQHDPGTGPLPANYTKHVRDRIWELRPAWQGTEYRFLYARIPDRRIAVVHAFKKKRRELREQDIVLAGQRLADLERRGWP